MALYGKSNFTKCGRTEKIALSEVGPKQTERSSAPNDWVHIICILHHASASPGICPRWYCLICNLQVDHLHRITTAGGLSENWATVLTPFINIVCCYVFVDVNGLLFIYFITKYSKTSLVSLYVLLMLFFGSYTTKWTKQPLAIFFHCCYNNVSWSRLCRSLS